MIEVRSKSISEHFATLNQRARDIINIHAALERTPIDYGKASIDLLEGWIYDAIPIMLRPEGWNDKPIDYVCGLVAEIEMHLGMEEMKQSSYAEMGRVEYKGVWKNPEGKSVPFYIFIFPENTCVFVETGEVETTETKIRKLVCA